MFDRWSSAPQNVEFAIGLGGETESASSPSDLKVGPLPSSIEDNFTARPIEAYASGFLQQLWHRLGKIRKHLKST